MDPTTRQLGDLEPDMLKAGWLLGGRRAGTLVLWALRMRAPCVEVWREAGRDVSSREAYAAPAAAERLPPSSCSPTTYAGVGWGVVGRR